MTKAKSTMSTLLLSGLSLLLCISMLVGSTFAWFTDSAASGSNVIKSGNLDIEVQYTLDGENWADLKGATDLFQKGLWEPGHTEVVALRIENKGSLALKYVANMNIINETIGKNKDGKDIVLSDILTVSTVVHQVNQVGDILLGMVFGGSQNTDAGTTKSFKTGNILASDRELFAGDAHYIIIKVDMAETVGNEANHDGEHIPSIEFGVNVLATQYTEEYDSFGNQYDKDATYPAAPIIVHNAEEAQAVLNNLKAGSTIQLVPGVNYGTLQIGAQVASENKKPVATNENTAAVDYFTTKYPTGEFVRKFEDITILGAPGAKVDGIKFVTGTFKVDIPETGKQSGTMYQWVEIKNLVIDGVEFTDASTLGTNTGNVSPIFMDLQSVKVNGLTVKNCKLEGNKSNMNFVYAYGSAAKDCEFGITLNDVVIVNNTVSGIARLCELREANNVMIKGNTVKNTTRELALLSINTDQVYSGSIICSGNIADAIASDYAAQGKEGLFFRVGAGGEANIIVEDNVITNSGCVEASFVGVTNHTGVLTVKNNTLG